METVKMPTPTDLLAKSEKKKKKAELAAKRRNRIMAQMSAMQKSFIKDNAELFASASTEITAASSDMDLRFENDFTIVELKLNMTNHTAFVVR